MDARHWLEQVAAELARRRLPRWYVERFVVELSDHLTDFMEDRMSTDAQDLQGVFQRMGGPAAVADRAAGEFRRARFSRRHPVLMFVALPLVTLPVLWSVVLVLLGLLGKTLGLETGSPSFGGPLWRVAEASVPYIVVALPLLPAAGAAVFFCWLANRASVGWKWPLAACVLVAVFASLSMVRIALPTTVSRGTLMVGLGMSLHPTAAQMLQFAVPMAIGGWAVWRQLKRTQSMLPS